MLSKKIENLTVDSTNVLSVLGTNGDLTLSKKIENLTVDLTNILSVVGTSGEIDASNKIYEVFAGMPYYKEHPELLSFLDFEDDLVNRKNVVAIVKGEKAPSDKTIVLIGHSDTVGISDYSGFEEYATKPYELAEKLKELKLPADAKEDLDSGNWLFGRGIFDMKCGVATIMTIMEDITKNISEFEGNLVFAAVGDEEGSSGGMLAFVPELVRLQEKHGFEYQAVVDTDYMAPRYENDEQKYIYVGTVGKLMPSFYVVGKETHVGQPYKGLDPNLITSAIITEVDKNIEYSDVVDKEVSLPPITLRNRDLKEEYSVQIPKTANLYFNYATHISTPDMVLQKMKTAAQGAFEGVVDLLNDRYIDFCASSKFPHTKLPWVPRVLTYDELYQLVHAEMGEKLEVIIEKYKNELLGKEEIDERDFGLKIIEKVQSLWSDKDPVVILYYSPPYYPHIYVNGSNDKEIALLESVSKAVESHDHGYNVINKKFYPYISDLSFVSAPQDEKILDTLTLNMPAFGSKYNLPIKDMQKLNLPVVNIGPFGKDAHQYTERIERKYSFDVAPKFVYETLKNLLK
ncbi:MULTISPECIES: M20/M25/M40 family metallo-hydrolase [Psychrilyobacter]|uniref:M20/M25/M40 family metallo-hydrolase n=1 Tax=Psychrilyobacter piezotolerans TaxID=2293438 RepID=A0ABX9KHC3_9FUSO|nr:MULTISPECIES: M20/M25/M40 family metallo-hydrolase [Psychrilyobacter]MCS5420645.1 M20/M25/M40 family metallo-hydrolase [Psychrilyobacter sp. S5]NDI77818.1 M20/M25/M40 family metallo-hydrolase [Psychrilyobacter piezotolerans]RDE62329.1 M20/M25/M40 family metallo-hydrolase [Psychrilyobacter sp. S5]REI41427.1 M20/M25/M40 family metallo-hydrolase [Psychrilyobacter piezotolerans]